MITDPRCELRLFMEGISCSVMSASVSTAVRLTAEIEVLPTKEVRNLKPMTNITLAFRDTAGKAPELVEPEETTYSVLFVGMVSSISLTKSGMSRSATISCVGHQFLLDRHYTYVSNIATQGFSHTKNFVGASRFLRTELGAGGLAYQVAACFKDEAPPFTPGLGDLSGPPRGAIKLIEKCIGVTLPAGSVKEGHVHGAQHEFFAHASHQCRLLFQIAGVSVDEGLNKIIDRDSAGKSLSAASAQMADHTDLSTMLDILLRQMYYKFTPIGTPRTVVSTDTDIVQRGKVLTDLQNKYAMPILAIAPGATLPNTLGQPTLIDLEASVEHIYKDIPKSSSKHATAEKRLRTLLSKDLKKVLPNLVVDIERLIPKDRVETFIDMSAPFIFNLLKMRHQAKELDEEQIFAVSATVSALLRNTAALSRVNVNDESGNKFCRVNSYSIMPDLTFCGIPTCNVIFPSQISTFNYNRDQFNMPTRLLLHSDMVANADETKGGVVGYYAPSTKEFSHGQGAVASTKEHMVPLLSHEKFTGIVPAFASISFYEKFKTLNVVGGPDETMLRIANFNLMLKRYESNGITCTGPFNPFVAAGFPIAFIDVDDVYAESPSMYVGVLSSVSHSYSGAGTASTTYTVRYAREVDEIDDVFGDAVLRATNSHSATPIFLSVDDEQAGPNFIDQALAALVTAISGIPVFQSAYDINDMHEITINGAKVTVRKPTQMSTVVGPLTKALPAEVRGRGILAADWAGLQAYSASLVLQNLVSPITKSEAIISVINREPYLNNVAKSARAASTFLSYYFEETDDVKALKKSLDAVASSARWDAAFTRESLVHVEGGLNIISLLQKKVTVKIRDGLHKQRSVNALKGEVQVNWWSLMPVDSTRMMEMIREGKTEFFDRAIVVPQNAEKEVAVYLEGPKSEGDAGSSDRVAVEELYRPPWFSDIFSIAKIGAEVYTPILGCGSVQDVVPLDVPRDTSVNTDEGSALTHTTGTSLLHAYAGYKNAPTNFKSEYVNSFVRRPIANVLDVLGADGLLTTEVADACVVDLGSICNPTKVRDLADVDATTKSLTFNPDALVLEKRRNVELYTSSIKGDAFR